MSLSPHLGFCEEAIFVGTYISDKVSNTLRNWLEHTQAWSSWL